MKLYFSAALCTILLTGCSSSSSTPDDSDGDAQNTVLTGVLVDSAVEGMTYTTASQSGVTNSAGEFQYTDGENVTFSIGTTVFPSVSGAPQVSPVDMAEGSSNPASTTTNIARLLQSLDVDGNPDNGISISTEAAANASAINFDSDPEQFENDAAVINLVANSGSVTSALISAEAANQHLADTLGTGEAGNSPPSYRNEIRDGEGESFITGNVVTLVSSSSDGSRQRNRLIVDTEGRLVADLAVTESMVEDEDASGLQARVYLKLYNDTVNTDEIVPANSIGDVSVVVTLQFEPSNGALSFYACTVRDIEDDQEDLFILGGANCIFEDTFLQIGERLKMGADFDRDTGMLSIVRGDSSFDFQLSGPFYPVIDTFNRVEIIARGGPGRMATEIYGIGSDDFEDDFSGGVLVEGINN